MPKIRYMKDIDGANQWFNKDPTRCWADLVMWQYMEEHSTIEEVGQCKGCDYCGRVTHGDYATVFSKEQRTDSK